MLPRIARRAAITFAIGLAATLGAHVAEAAKECHQETPLPPNAAIATPDAAVPESLASFSGAWIGAWKDKQGVEALRTWNFWDGQRRRCYAVHRAGDRLQLHLEGRWTTVLFERVPDGIAGKR